MKRYDKRNPLINNYMNDREAKFMSYLFFAMWFVLYIGLNFLYIYTSRPLKHEQSILSMWTDSEVAVHATKDVASNQ